METGLAIVAVCLLLVYSVYFFYIIRSKPEEFEKMLLSGLADWMISHKEKSRRHLRLMLGGSFLVETLYFVLVFLVIQNLFFRVLTGLFVGFEFMHLTLLLISMNQFFRGRIPLKYLFNWKIERASAWLFFTHSLLVLVQLAWR